jgi:hypothetical protein
MTSRDYVKPALLAVVKHENLEMAFSDFSGGKEEIYFGTNADQIAPAFKQQPQRVYFRTGGELISRARIAGFTRDNPIDKRLTGPIGLERYKYYYGFKDLTWLSNPIPYTSVTRYPRGTLLRHDDTGVFRINEPMEDEDAVEELQQRTDIPRTKKLALIAARTGQGVFRANVEKIEEGCRVTGLKYRTEAPAGVLQAGHIRPWSKSNDTEKLDGNNGLLFSPHVHYLFDQGYLTFEADGQSRLSCRLPKEVREHWNLERPVIRIPLSREQEYYMAYHRNEIFDRNRR